MMSTCEHFIYTSAEISSKKGYQIIAKSPGVSEEIISDLSDYFYPVGILPNQFRQSCSLLLLRNNMVAFSRIRNIGIGYDGRQNTLYNHTILMKLEDFNKLNNDSRLLQEHYLEIPNYKEEILTPMVIESRILPPDNSLSLEIDPESLEVIMRGLFRRRKVAILKIKDVEYIPSILSILPPSLRLISFSTLVGNPDKQPKFHFIETPKQNRILLKNDFIIIDPQTSHYNENEPIDEFAKSIRYLTDVAIFKNSKLLQDIHTDFEKIPGQDFVDKITLVTNYQQFNMSIDKVSKEKHAFVMLEILQRLDEQTTLEYLNRIKTSLSDLDIDAYYLKIKINKIVADSMNSPLDINNIEKMFSKLESYTGESRRQLLKELIKKRERDFLKNAKNLLIEASLSSFWHADEVLRVILESDVASRCIDEVLGIDSDISNIKKQNVFAKLIEKSIEYNPKLVLELLNYNIFNFSDIEDLSSFKKIINNLCSTRKFYAETNPGILLRSVIIVQSKIQESVLNKDAHTHNSLSTKKLRHAIKIIKILLELIQYMQSSRKEELLNLTNEVNDEKEKLVKILDNYNLPDDPKPINDSLALLNPFMWPYLFNPHDDD